MSARMSLGQIDKTWKTERHEGGGGVTLLFTETPNFDIAKTKTAKEESINSFSSPCPGFPSRIQPSKHIHKQYLMVVCWQQDEGLEGLR